MANEIEKLIVAIESNITDLIEGVEDGVDKAESKLKDFEKSGKKAFDGAVQGAKSLWDKLREITSGFLSSKKSAEDFGKSTKDSFGQSNAATLTNKLQEISKKFLDGKISAEEFDKAKKDAFEKFNADELPNKLQEISKQFLDGKVSAEEFDRATKNAFDKTGKSADKLGSTLTTLTQLAAAFVASFVVDKVVGFFSQIAGAAVDANAEFEVYTTQFETLLGSAEAAEQRLAELAQFGLTTPFELNEITNASRVLQVFGGTTLATGDNLRMIGDIAAGVNQPFQDVAFWVGRMYDAIQNGQPFGEAAARLQEMGALSGDTRRKLEDLQKSGADGAEIFAIFSEEVGGKFAGNMEKLAGTFQGVMSNLEDFRSNLLRIGGEAYFDQVKDDAKTFLDIISEEDRQQAIFNLAKAFGEAAAMAQELVTSPIFELLGDVEPDTIQDLAESIERAASAASEFSETDVDANINGLIDSVTVLIDVYTTIINLLNRGKESGNEAALAFDFLKEIFGLIKDVLTQTLFPIGNLVDKLGEATQAIAEMGNAIEIITGLDLTGWTEKLAESSETAARKQERLIEVTQESQNVWQQQMNTFAQVPPVIDEVTDAVDELAEAQKKSAEIAKEQLTKATEDFIDATEERNEKLQELETEHNERVAEIDQEFWDKRADAIKDYDDALVKLEQDSADRRKDAAEKQAKALEDLEEETARSRTSIFQKARDALSKLAMDTNRSIAKEQQSFQTDEKRETEDHLREMRDLRTRYLDDLEGAVKNRDARAVVDLQKKFQHEQQAETESFQTKQSRDREDQNLRLQEIRENEAIRAAEIMAAQQRELQNLEETERRKREKIQETYDEDVAKIAETEQRKKAEIEKAFAEKIAQLDEQLLAERTKEDEDYAERQTKLNEALAKRLEATAKNLADIEELNSGHARRLLGALNETFGVGGNIDKLMQDFENRRKRKLVVEMSFEGKTGSGGNDGGKPEKAPGYKPQKSFARGTPGELITRPTNIMVGEGGEPEWLTVTPLSQLKPEQLQPPSSIRDILGSDSLSMNKSIDLSVAFSGSAPPGIRSGDRDQIAMVLVNALREAGVMNKSNQ